VSNLVGDNIYNLIYGSISSAVTGTGAFGCSPFTFNCFWQGTTNFGLSTIGIVAAIVLIVLNFFTVLLAVLAIFVAITARSVVLMLLVIISPLAFVAALLPNTEKWFQKWLNTYVQLLVIYPLFMAAWAACRGLQTIIFANPDAGDFSHILALILPVAPALMIIPLFKASGGLMGKMTGAIQGGLQKSPLGTWAKKHDESTQKRAQDLARNRGGWLGQKLTGEKFEQAEQAREFKRKREGTRRYADRYRSSKDTGLAAAAQSAKDALETQEKKDMKVLLDVELNAKLEKTPGLSVETELQNMLEAALKKGEESKAVAIGNMMQARLGSGAGASAFNKTVDKVNAITLTNPNPSKTLAGQTSIKVARSIDGSAAIIERDITRGMAQNLGITHSEFMSRLQNTGGTTAERTAARNMVIGWAKGTKPDDILALNAAGVRNVFSALTAQQIADARALAASRGGGRTDALGALNWTPGTSGGPTWR